MVKPNKSNRFGSKAKDIGVAFDEAKEIIITPVIEETKIEDEVEEEIVTDSQIETVTEIKEQDKMEDTVVEEIKTSPKKKSEKKTEELKEDNNFILVKKAEKDIKTPKIFNLKYSNILKIKEIKEATGMSESAILDYLIEQSTKILQIK
jgi:hypothetical protein